MHFTNSSSFNAARALPLVALATLPLVEVGFAADPYQPIRALVLAAALAVLLPALTPLPRDSRLRAPLALVVLVLAGSIASTLAAGPAAGVFGVHGRFQSLVSLVLFALAGAAGVVLHPTAGESRLFARALAAVLCVESGSLLLQRFTGAEPVGTMGNSVLAAGWLVTAAAFVLGAAMGERGRWRIALLAAGWLGLAAVGVSATRGAWLAVPGVLLLLALVGRSSARKSVYVGTVVLFVGILLAGSASGSKLSPSDLATGSAGSRVEIWRGAASMIAEYPVLGVGVGRFLYEYPRFQTPQHVQLEGADTRTDQAHSIYLQQAAETGIPSALGLLALVASALWAGTKASKRGDALGLAATAGLLAWSIQALFGISTIETDALAWFFGGLALSRSLRGVVPATAGRLPSRTWNVLGAVMAACVLMLCVQYLRADMHYARSSEYLASARFDEATSEARQAVSSAPVVDTYRVAVADASAYLVASGESTRAQSALAILDAGLILEPNSYDLAAARASMLALSADRDAQAVWDAYLRAMRLYPHGVDIRVEASAWAQGDGSDEMQARAAAELARVNDVAGP